MPVEDNDLAVAARQSSHTPSKYAHPLRTSGHSQLMDMGTDGSTIDLSSNIAAFSVSPNPLTLPLSDPGPLIPSKSHRMELPSLLGQNFLSSPSPLFDERLRQGANIAILSQQTPSAWNMRGYRRRVDDADPSSTLERRRDASPAQSTAAVSSTAYTLGTSTLPPPYAEYE